jgi:hypothetical protein
MQIAFDLESTALAGEGGSNYETLRSLAPADSRGKDSLSISQSVRATVPDLAPGPGQTMAVLLRCYELALFGALCVRRS